MAQNRVKCGAKKAKILPLGIPGIQPKVEGDSDNIKTLQQHESMLKHDTTD